MLRYRQRLSLEDGAARIWFNLAKRKLHLPLAYLASNFIIYSNSAGGGKSVSEFVSSGAMGFAQGEIDELKYLRINDKIIHQAYFHGINPLYRPNFYGGIQSGGGGIGSLSNKGTGRKIGVWYGSQTQRPTLTSSIAASRNDYHYRGIAHISWDSFPWGTDSKIPDISGMVTRINKQTDGRDQWQKRYARIDTTVD